MSYDSSVSDRARKNAKFEYLDYQIPVTQFKGPKGNGDMEAARRDCNAPQCMGVLREYEGDI